MAYIIGLIVVGMFFLALNYFTEMKTKDKIVISSGLLLIIVLATAFNMNSSKQRERMMDVVNKFNQNKNIHCDNFKINKKNYELSIGTYTFIAKKNSPNYGQMISVSNCR